MLNATSETARAQLHFTVRGRGEFPQDLLSYDECQFASDDDRFEALNLERTRHRREVELVCTGERAHFFKPTVARWESFGWRVVASDNGRVSNEVPAAKAASQPASGRSDQPAAPDPAPAKGVVAWLHRDGSRVVTAREKYSMQHHEGVPGTTIARDYCIALEPVQFAPTHNGARLQEAIALLNEVRGTCTRDDDLPDGLLERIDALVDGAESETPCEAVSDDTQIVDYLEEHGTFDFYRVLPQAADKNGNRWRWHEYEPGGLRRSPTMQCLPTLRTAVMRAITASAGGSK